MTFLESVKQEILNSNIKQRHCRQAFLAGLIRGAGTLYEKDGELGLEIRANGEDTATYIGTQLKSLFNYEVREVSVSEDRLNKKDKFLLNVTGDGALSILQTLDI